MKAIWVTDRRATGDSRFEGLLAALAGTSGLSVQLREKDVPDGECLLWAKRARLRLGETRLFVNRRLDIALAARADGVHLQASGLPLSRVRSAAGRELRVGVSTHSAVEASRAIGDGADVVILGPIFDTPSKRAFGAPLGPRVLEALPPKTKRSAEIYAIGGITAENIRHLDPYRDRIDGIAAIRYFQEAADPRAAAEVLAAR